MIICLASTCSLALPMPMEEGYKYPEPEIPFTLPPRRTTTTTTTTTRAPTTTGYKYPVWLDRLYRLQKQCQMESCKRGSAAQWTCDGRGLGRPNLNSPSGAGKSFDSAAKKDDKKNNYNNHNNPHHHNRIQLQHTRNVATI